MPTFGPQQLSNLPQGQKPRDIRVSIQDNQLRLSPMSKTQAYFQSHQKASRVNQ